MHMAADYGHVAAAELLIAAGADVNLADKVRRAAARSCRARALSLSRRPSLSLAPSLSRERESAPSTLEGHARLAPRDPLDERRLRENSRPALFPRRARRRRLWRVRRAVRIHLTSLGSTQRPPRSRPAPAAAPRRQGAQGLRRQETSRHRLRGRQRAAQGRHHRPSALRGGRSPSPGRAAADRSPRAAGSSEPAAGGARERETTATTAAADTRPPRTACGRGRHNRAPGCVGLGSSSRQVAWHGTQDLPRGRTSGNLRRPDAADPHVWTNGAPGPDWTVFQHPVYARITRRFRSE